jgi:hypothetical protein
MARSTHVQRDGVAHAAGRILIAWRNGKSADLNQELENARSLAAQTEPCTPPGTNSTLEMERLEVLSSAIESLGNMGGKHAGALRLLEHLVATAMSELNSSEIN